MRLFMYEIEVVTVKGSQNWLVNARIKVWSQVQANL